MKKRISLSFDVLKDDPGKIAFKICLPLAAVVVISWFTSSLVNAWYARYGGEYFAVQGLIGIVISTLNAIISTVIAAAWIKTAKFYTEKSEGLPSAFLTTLCAAFLVETALVGVCLLCKQPIFTAFHIPDALYQEASDFYTASLLAHFICAAGSFGILLINGVGDMKQLFIGNLFNSCGVVVTAAVSLRLLQMGIVGAALVPPLCSGLVGLYAVVVLKRRGIRVLARGKGARVDWRLFGSILKAGAWMTAQVLLCQLGEIFISLQTNRYLSVDYITVLSVNLPLSGVLNTFTSASMVFFPANYLAGEKKRVRRFLRIMMSSTVLYGCLCALLYGVLGRWYYGIVLEDAALIPLGAEYWLLYGVGIAFVSVIFVLRYFFDCVGYNKTAFCAGIAQMLGGLFVAFVLIPHFGGPARSLSLAVQSLFADAYLIVMYLLLRKRIYK